MARLFYLHDPLCGWCYAAAPLVDAPQHIAASRVKMARFAIGGFPGAVHAA